MEADLAGLTLEEEEDEILQIQTDRGTKRDTEILQLAVVILFCEIRMEVGAETAELGWDLSIRAQSRRAQMMTSVWLREEGEGQGRQNNGEK
ncbi:hypothetical protein Godav_011112 [Gossypium davidsonii]|uniref:Uncharacterized protein n=1 Tax=Gossypium davidsonii TaxID=34287 RepID=A0A7J8RA72_GOSDV|nr:hypothetical protein [Gossypium davidsonii]